MKNRKTTRSCFPACLLFFLLLSACAGTGGLVLKPGSDEELLIKQADVLLKLRKYESAFLLLGGYEGENQFIIAKRIDIVVNFFADSMMHKMFALKDLEEGEDLMELRQSENSYVMYKFDPEQYACLVDNNPRYTVLAKSLGDYYYDAFYRYGDDWVYDSHTSLEKAYIYYSIARKGGVFDYMTLANEAHYLLTIKNTEEAIALLDQSIEMNPDYPTNHYNLAFAYNETNQKDLAIEEAVKAYKLYKVAAKRYDAIIMAVKLSMETGNLKLAEELLLETVVAFPKASDPVYYLIYLYLKQKNFNKAEEIAMATFSGYPTYPSVSGMILNAYDKAGQVDKYIALVSTMIHAYTDDEILGNLYYHRALGYIKLDNKDKALFDIKEAEQHFNYVLNSDHQVFGEIARIKADLIK